MGSQAPDTLLRLVERFERQRDAYTSSQYNEAQLPKAKTPHERGSIERTIAATDKQIDALVYELYGLTEQEIRTVEGEDK
jgi:hypothetical protein